MKLPVLLISEPQLNPMNVTPCPSAYVIDDELFL
jgi:hypothetical protein